MRGPYGFDPNENCQSCKLRASGFFCQLSALKDFNAVKSLAMYPGGATLFLEKQEPRGVFVLCAGQVKLSISSSAGKKLILRIAKAGEILARRATRPADSGSARVGGSPRRVLLPVWQQGLKGPVLAALFLP